MRDSLSELWQWPCSDQYSAQPACSSTRGHGGPAFSGSCWTVLKRRRTVALQGSAQPDHWDHSVTTQDTAGEGEGGGHRCSLQVTGVSGGSGVEANHNQFFPNFFCLLFLVFGCLVVSFSLRRLNVASGLNMFNFLFFNSVTKAS